jgi:phosphohistidine phosphatase SixA
MYHIVLTDGQRDDLTAYVNHSLLVSHWPVLRRLVGRVIRDAWESAFPELNEGHPATL